MTTRKHARPAETAEDYASRPEVDDLVRLGRRLRREAERGEAAEGRTRFSRFFAVSIPAVVASIALGGAILNGSVAAALTASDGVEFHAARVDAASMNFGLYGAGGSTGGGIISSGSGAVTQVSQGQLPSGACVTTTASLPFVGTVNVQLALPNDSNVTQLELDTSKMDFGSANLPATTISSGGAFQMTSTTSGQAVQLSDVRAELHGVTLDQGVNLGDVISNSAACR
jgi:hypothetical protein